MDSQRKKILHWDLLLTGATLRRHCRLLVEIEQAMCGCQIYPRQIVRDYINEYFVDLRNILL